MLCKRAERVSPLDDGALFASNLMPLIGGGGGGIGILNDAIYTNNTINQRDGTMSK